MFTSQIGVVVRLPQAGGSGNPGLIAFAPVFRRGLLCGHRGLLVRSAPVQGRFLPARPGGPPRILLSCGLPVYRDQMDLPQSRTWLLPGRCLLIARFSLRAYLVVHVLGSPTLEQVRDGALTAGAWWGRIKSAGHLNCKRLLRHALS